MSNCAFFSVQVVKTLQGRRDEDQVAIAKEAKRTKSEIATLNDNVAALQAVNADLKGDNLLKIHTNKIPSSYPLTL